MLAYERHAATGAVLRSRESLQLLGKDDPGQTSGQQRFANRRSDESRPLQDEKIRIYVLFLATNRSSFSALMSTARRP